MNILTLIVMVILALFMFRGYKNGLAKSLVSSFSLLITIVLVAYVTPYVAQFLEENTGIREVVMEQCQKSFSIRMDENKAINKSDGTVSDIHDAMIDQLNIPSVIKEGLKKHNNVQTYKALGVKNFNEYVPKYIADLVIKAMVFVLSWILAAVALYFLVKWLKLVTSLPGVKGLNRILGVVFGMAQGLIVIWIMFLIITMIGGFGIGARLLGMIAESKFLELLYDTNLVLRLIQFLAQGFV